MQKSLFKSTGDDISILGFGCMRFAKDANDKILFEKTYQQICFAVEHGVNYIDTAYVYEGSEVVVGEILKKANLRDKVYLATKLPRWQVLQESDFFKFFNEELERLQTDYFDYYFIHCLNHFSDWEDLKKLGVLNFIKSIKQSKQIKHIGFSFHGGYEEFVKILDDFDWEFCMLQYNFIDENNQAGKRGISYAASKGIGVIVMEPLRGGIINNLDDKAKAMFDELNKISNKNLSIAQWCLKWVWDNENVNHLISGMNDIKQVEENLEVSKSREKLTLAEIAIFKKIQIYINSLLKVPCTACQYCKDCPKEIEIADLFSLYNAKYLKNEDSNASYKKLLSKDKGANRCIQCGKCELKCPQHIEIRNKLKELHNDLTK